jgi:hypothetical protein
MEMLVIPNSINVRGHKPLFEYPSHLQHLMVELTFLIAVPRRSHGLAILACYIEGK